MTDVPDTSPAGVGERLRRDTALISFVIEAGQLVPSAAAAIHGPLERMALRESWLNALLEIGMTEEQALAAGNGAWKRGLAAVKRFEKGPAA